MKVTTPSSAPMLMKRREGEYRRLDQVAQPLEALEQPQDAQDARDAQIRRSIGGTGRYFVEEVGRILVDERHADEEEVEAVPRDEK